MPPPRTKPAANAPAASSGSFDLTAALGSAAARISSTAATSCSRSAAICARTCSSVSAAGAPTAIRLHRLLRHLRLRDRLLGYGRHAALERAKKKNPPHPPHHPPPRPPHPPPP